MAGLPPELPSAQPLPAPPRQTWTWYQWITIVILAVTGIFAGFTAWPTIKSIASGVPAASLSDTGYAALTTLAFVAGWLTVSVVLRFRQRVRKRRSLDGAPSRDRVNEFLVLVGRSKQLWSPASSFMLSFAYLASQLSNRLNSPPVPDPSNEIQRLSTERANFIFYSWRAGSAASDGTFWEIDRLIGDGAVVSKDAFLSSILLLRQVLNGAITTANFYADQVRQVHPSRRDDYMAAQWRDFRDKANRFSDDFTTFAERVKREYGWFEPVFFFLPVGDVSPSNQ
jgi:hypothetical protein